MQIYLKVFLEVHYLLDMQYLLPNSIGGGQIYHIFFNNNIHCSNKEILFYTVITKYQFNKKKC